MGAAYPAEAYLGISESQTFNYAQDYSATAYADDPHPAQANQVGVIRGGLDDEDSHKLYPIVYISPAGLLTVLMRQQVAIEMTMDKTIRVVNHKHKSVAACNSRGNSSCLYHSEVKVFQENTTSEVDLYWGRKAKMTTNNIFITSGEEKYDMNSHGIFTDNTEYRDLSKDMSVSLLFASASYGPHYIPTYNDIAQNATYTYHKRGGTTVLINGMRIYQNSRGDVMVSCGPKYIRVSPLNGTMYLETHFVEMALESDWKVRVKRGEHRLLASYQNFMVSDGYREAGFDEQGQMFFQPVMIITTTIIDNTQPPPPPDYHEDSFAAPLDVLDLRVGDTGRHEPTATFQTPIEHQQNTTYRDSPGFNHSYHDSYRRPRRQLRRIASYEDDWRRHEKDRRRYDSYGHRPGGHGYPKGRSSYLAHRTYDQQGSFCEPRSKSEQFVQMANYNKPNTSSSFENIESQEMAQVALSATVSDPHTTHDRGSECALPNVVQYSSETHQQVSVSSESANQKENDDEKVETETVTSTQSWEDIVSGEENLKLVESAQTDAKELSEHSPVFDGVVVGSDDECTYITGKRGEETGQIDSEYDADTEQAAESETEQAADMISEAEQVTDTESAVTVQIAEKSELETKHVAHVELELEQVAEKELELEQVAEKELELKQVVEKELELEHVIDQSDSKTEHIVDKRVIN